MSYEYDENNGLQPKPPKKNKPNSGSKKPVKPYLYGSRPKNCR